MFLSASLESKCLQLITLFMPIMGIPGGGPRSGAIKWVYNDTEMQTAENAMLQN